MMFAKKFALVAILAASVCAQDPTTIPSGTDTTLPTDTGLPSDTGTDTTIPTDTTPTGTSSGVNPTSSISPCILTCAQSSTLCTFTDATCVCSNTQYQQAVATCLQSQCTTDDQTQAAAIQQALCAGVSSLSSAVSSRSSVLSSSISSRASSLTSSRTSTSPTGTSAGGSGGAAGLSASLVATGAAVLLGVIGGGLLVF